MNKVYFTDIQTEIQSLLRNAQDSVHIALAWFTNESLFDSLLDLLSKGVEVTVILMHDEINCNTKSLDFNKFIIKGGNLNFVENCMMHNKFCIIDSKVIITGSYNWTYSAEYLNAENIIVINDNQIALKFEEQFSVLKSSANKTVEYVPFNVDEASDIKRKFIEKEINYKTENIGSVQIPELAKDDSNIIKHRLCSISIGTIFRGQLKGKKYVHAKYCTSHIQYADYWVDIIDDKFVEEIRHYFHKKNGGFVEDYLPVKPIPEEIYNLKKYKFNFVNCWFNKEGHHKMSTNADKILVNSNGKAYSYKEFHTLVRYSDDRHQYAIYKSMHDACRLICKSLFDKDVSSDIKLVSDLSLVNGVFRLKSEDDIRYITTIYSRNQYNNYEQLLRIRLQNDPNCFWVDIKQNYASAQNVIYGYYSVDKINHSIQPSYARWFVIEEFLSLRKYDCDITNFIETVIMDLKNEGRKGIVITPPELQEMVDWTLLKFKSCSLDNRKNLVCVF